MYGGREGQSQRRLSCRRPTAFPTSPTYCFSDVTDHFSDVGFYVVDNFSDVGIHVADHFSDGKFTQVDADHVIVRNALHARIYDRLHFVVNKVKACETQVIYT